MTTPPPLRPGRRRLAAAGILLLASMAAGCGLPRDDQAHPLANDEIPYGLADPATSSTTTEPPSADTVVTSPATGEAVRLYFPGDDGLFESVVRRITRPVTLEEVVGTLAQGPQAAGGTANLRSVVGAGDVQGVELRAGIATVALGNHFGELPPSEQRLAVAQLVLTLTARPGVGQVTFQVGDQPADVPRPNGALTKAAVSRDDYSSMLKPGD